MSAVLKKLDPHAELERVVKTVLSESNQNLVIAAKRLRAELSKSPRLRDELLAPYLDKAILAELKRLSGKRSARHTTAAPAPAALDGLKGLARANRADYLDGFTLYIGKALGDADKMDLIREASARRDLANTAAAHYRFISRLAEYLQGPNTVRKQFNNQRLAQLMSEAERG